MAIGEGIRGIKVWEGLYDFAVDGGATGTIVLRGNDGPLPNGSNIIGGYLDVITSCASATGTMALNSEGAADILAATAAAGLTAGRKDIIPDATGSTAVKLTAARNPALVIATLAFTAGKFSLVLIYR
jgi:hypothetical protein